MKAKFICNFRACFLSIIMLLAVGKAFTQANNCVPPSLISLTDLTPTNLDITWNAVLGAVDYHVLVTSNGTVISDQYPIDTTLNITGPFAVGDEIEIDIATGCANGEYSSPFHFEPQSGGILATVDIILLRKGVSCNGCPYAKCSDKLFPTSEINDEAKISIYYECECGCPNAEGQTACEAVLAFSENFCDKDGNPRELRASSSSTLEFSGEEAAEKKTIVQEYNLKVFPNPSITSSTISFYLQEEVPVSLSIFDQFGREVKSFLNNKILSEGPYEFLISNEELIEGMYYVMLMADERPEIIKFVKMK